MNRVMAMIAALGMVSFAATARAADAVEAALGTCWSCHGADGLPKDPTIPIIWGQHAGYIEKQLRDYRAGDRDNQIMSSMAEAVPFKDLARAAAIIAGKGWPKQAPPPAGTSAPDSVAACQACHGEKFMGGQSPEGIAPRLAGQFTEYLDEQMSDFARGQRANQKTMTALMKALSADDRKTIATYLAGL
jgi:cytochrome c553